MKKTLLSIAALTAIGSSAYAEMLQPEEALSRALGAAPSKVASLQEAQTKLVFTANDEVGLPAVYVFNTQNGYCVVAADDMAHPLLGYADSAFDPANMPPSLKYWLGEYSRQIDWARQNGAKAPSKQVWQDFDPISPICTTTWNQSEPYNNMCPEYESGKRCITGCVATAMAQVMKAHNWPDVGVGHKSYPCDGIGKILSINFASKPFVWDKMLNNYNNNPTDEEKDAVALLMKACGYSVEMNYTSGACGAQSKNVAIALPKYFKYDNGIQYQLRDFYDLREWQTMIYNELKEGRPVYYSGSNSEAGHAFVCDGYNGDGYFHINWGWNGASDGYFLLTGLDPAEQGLGGSSAGYNNWQEAVLNVKPAKEGETSPANQWLASFDISTQQSTYNLGEEVALNRPCYNYTIYDIPGVCALKLKKESGDSIIISGRNFNAVAAGGFYSMFTLPADLEEGTYTGAPCWIDEQGACHEVRVVLYAPHTYTVTVKDGKATFAPNPVKKPKYEDAKFSPIFVNGMVKGEALAVNTWNHDFFYQVKVSVQDAAGKEVLATPYTRVDVPAEESQPFEYIATLSVVNGATIDYNAKYYAYITDDTNENLSDPVEVTVNKEATPEFSAVLSVTDGNVDAVDYNNLDFTAVFDVTEGVVADRPTLWVYNTFGDAQCYLQGEMLMLGKGQSASVQFKGASSKLRPRQRYKCQVWWGGKWASNSLSFKIDANAGIESAAADEQPVSVEYFNLQGLAVERTVPGSVYVERATYADGSQQTRTIIAK